MKTRDDSSRRFRLSHVQAEFFAITVEASWRAMSRRRGRKSMNSHHRNPGCRLVIAGFRLRLSRRPRRPGIIFRFCDISRVCGQENFPSISAPRWPSHAGRLSATRLGACGQENFPPFLRRVGREPCGTTLATRLRSSRKWLVREAAVAVEFTPARSRAPSPSRSGNARPFRHRRVERSHREATRPSTSMGRRGSGPNEKSRGVWSRMRLRLQRNDHPR